MKHNKFVTAILLTLCATPISYADSTVVYELSNKAGDKVEHTISISGRWLRIDSVPKGKTDYTVMDTGRLLKFDIDEKAKSYQVTSLVGLHWPETPIKSPKFKPIRKKKAVSGMRCQPVNEMGKDRQAVAEHCMATGGSLKLNAREMITLSRLFMAAPRLTDNLGDDWLGVATPDERQVSILSQNSAGDRLELKSVSHGWIDKKLLKIPVDYKRLKPDLPVKQKKQQKPEQPVKQKK